MSGRLAWTHKDGWTMRSVNAVAHRCHWTTWLAEKRARVNLHFNRKFTLAPFIRAPAECLDSHRCPDEMDAMRPRSAENRDEMSREWDGSKKQNGDFSGP
jgi:hypothetical protein